METSKKNLDVVRKIRYQLYSAELNKVVEKFCESELIFAVLKGVPLSQKLYAEPWCRSFSDMDLLVLPECLLEAVRILEDMGYVSESETDKESVMKYLEKTDRNHHLEQFQKKVAIDYVLELHVDILPVWMFQTDRELTSKMLARRKIRQGFPVLESYDELIFQMLHLIT